MDNNKIRLTEAQKQKIFSSLDIPCLDIHSPDTALGISEFERIVQRTINEMCFIQEKQEFNKYIQNGYIRKAVIICNEKLCNLLKKTLYENRLENKAIVVGTSSLNGDDSFYMVTDDVLREQIIDLFGRERFTND